MHSGVSWPLRRLSRGPAAWGKDLELEIAKVILWISHMLKPKYRAQALRYRFHVGTAEFADRSYYP